MSSLSKRKILWDPYDIFKYHDIGKDKEKIQEFLDSGFYIVQCDASHNYQTRWGSASVVVTKPNGNQYSVKNFSFKSPGPVYAEMKAMIYGLREIQKIRREVYSCLILNDNYFAINFAVGNFTPKKPHIVRLTSEMIEELENIGFEAQFGLVRSKINRKVDKSAKKTLKNKERETEKRIEKRVQKILENIEKGRKFIEYQIEDGSVKLKDPGSSFWFEISFEPFPSCNCYWWKYNWENKGEKIINARALPCVHMCRAAEILELNIFDIFRKQIFRRD